jgi:RNA polymerase sigma-70 factor (ECF subfamily)
MSDAGDPNKTASSNVSSGDGLDDAATLAAFEDLYTRRGADALRYATAILGADDARDATQDAWLRVWRAWGSAEPDRLDAWAFRIVRNACIDRRRARRPTDELDEAALPTILSADDIVPGQVDAANAIPLLAKLPQAFREILWLREVMEMSYAEIAEVQDVPIGTVMSRLHAARRKAASVLRKEGW